MGYREYFAKIKKGFIDECKNVKKLEDYIEVTRKYYPEVIEDKDCELQYKDADETIINRIPFYAFKNVIFEFGKEYEFSTELKKMSLPLFRSSEDMQEEFDPFVVDEQGLIAVIKEQERYIVDYYKKLMNDLDNNDNLSTEKKLARAYSCLSNNTTHIYSDYFDIGFVNLDKDSPYLTNSWLYEHNIFNLVHLYKTFDWDNYSLVFYGW